MRSRPLVRLLVDRSIVEPGSTFDIDVALTSRSDTPTEVVDLIFTAEVTVAIPQGKTVATRQKPIMIPQTYRWHPGTLVRGEHRQRVRLSIPPNVPPSYRSAASWCRVDYTIEVHVAIPMWIDRRAHFTIPVAATPSVPKHDTGTLVATNPRGPAAGEIYIEASLESTDLVVGEELRGDVSFANVKAHRVRRVTIAFVGYEMTSEPFRAMNVVTRHAATLVSGAPPEGESFPFRFVLPKDSWPSFDALFFSLHWQLEVRVDVVFGADVVISVPLQVRRLAPGMESPPRSKRALPVGRQRLARLWAFVAQRVGPPLSFDESDGSMIASRGGIAMKLAREAYEGTLGTVAHFRYPHLGLDLHLGGRGVFDALAVRGRYEPKLARARQRFTIEGREHAQLEAFLDDELLSYLASATAATMDDDLAHVRVAGSAASSSTLETVARSAVRLLDLLDAAVTRIPPPRVMAAFTDAWRDLATRASGRFEPGRMWIHDATRAGFRFEIGTVWEPHGSKPMGTIARVPIEPPLASAPAVEDASLSATAREALRGLVATPGFHASTDELVVFSSEMVGEPAKLLAHVDAMVVVLRVLRGTVATGPFR